MEKQFVFGDEYALNLPSDTNNTCLVCINVISASTFVSLLIKSYSIYQIGAYRKGTCDKKAEKMIRHVCHCMTVIMVGIFHRLKVFEVKSETSLLCTKYLT